MKKFILIIKGILMGFVSVAIPGLSASTIGIELGVYNQLIESIANIFKKFRKSIGFLLFLWIGFGIGSFGGAIIVENLYLMYPLAIILCILGFVFGGIPHMTTEMKPNIKKISCWITLIITLLVIGVYNYFVNQREEVSFENMQLMDYIWVVIIGIITSSTLVIPGVDFAVVLLSLGYYYPLLGAISNLLVPSTFLVSAVILSLYLVGYLAGAFIFSKIIKILLNKFPAQTSYASFAFVIAAPIIVIEKCIINNDYFFVDGAFSFSVMGTHYRQLIIGILLFIFSFFLIFLIPKFSKKEKVQNQYKSDLYQRNEELFKGQEGENSED